MKKVIFYGLLVLLIVASVPFYFLQKSEELSHDSKPIAVDTQFVCEEDTDCILTDLNVICSVCSSCDSIDYSNEAYLAVNRKWLATHRETWINANCSEDFKRCVFNITSDMGEAYSVCLMRYFSCPACLPTIPDSTYKAKCIANVCQKTTL